MIDAHYKAINVMKITSDDAALITGSEDSIVKVWLLNECVLLLLFINNIYKLKFGYYYN